MATTFSRTDRSIFGRWWWTVDRWMLAALFAIFGAGIVFIMAATPAVADRLHLDAFYFARRQFVVVPMAICVLIGVSLLSPRNVRRLATVVFAGALGALLLLPLVGTEVNGATRWLSLGSFNVQPSEMMKPAFAVVTAWMFAEYRMQEGFPGNWIAIALYGLVISLLLIQPDLGQTFLVSLVWFGQFFLAGLPVAWIVGFGACGVIGLIAAYHYLPHVAERIDVFLDPTSGDTYQVDKAIEAFANGGLMGRGPGEGVIKNQLPDAHTDFILAVIGEEFGLVICLLLLALFAFVVLRGLGRLIQEPNLFVVLASAGLLAQFGLQALVNMGSTLRLIPAKGLTLPFISYGGSSLIAMAFAMGMVLALTRRRPGQSGVEL
jgi:cell division protein FtsW